MKDYLDKLKAKQNDPHGLSDLHIELSHLYGLISQEYEDYLPIIATTRKQFMKEFSTVTKADRMYELSPVGIQEKGFKIRLKSLEKLIAGCRRRIETYDKEAQNQY